MKHLFYYFLFIISLFSCGNPPPDTDQKPSRHHFKAVFTTTQGTFTAIFHEEWAPLGVAHLEELIKNNFYSDIGIFRVVDDYVVQFGIHNDSSLNQHWISRQISDEPVLHPNKQWTIAYARDGANTRDTQIFINLKDNSERLDTINYMGCRGFPVIGEIVEGTETISKFYKEYGNAPAMEQDSIYAYGNAYLKKKYPNIDYLIKVEIVEE